MSEWIKCSERLPCDGEPVIVFCVGAEQSGLAWRNKGDWWIPEPQAVGYDSITHWQPLPPLPEQE